LGGDKRGDTVAAIKETVKRREMSKNCIKKASIGLKFDTDKLRNELERLKQQTTNSRDDDIWKQHVIKRYPWVEPQRNESNRQVYTYSEKDKQYSNGSAKNCSKCDLDDVNMRKNAGKVHRKRDCGEVSWTRFYCSCDPKTPLCHEHVLKHLNEVWKSKHGGDSNPSIEGHKMINRTTNEPGLGVALINFSTVSLP